MVPGFTGLSTYSGGSAVESSPTVRLAGLWDIPSQKTCPFARTDWFWRDYHLPPGMSDAWSAAWVGWCLASRPPPLRSEARSCLQRALRALSGCRCAGGWGYNRTTGPDADSTAWVVRFLSHLGASVGPSVAGLAAVFGGYVPAPPGTRRHAVRRGCRPSLVTLLRVRAP